MTSVLTLPTGITGVDLGSEVSVTARTLKAPFGNNYTQRSGDGRNVLNREYNVSFKNLTRAEAKIITDQFEALKGYIAFYHTISGESTQRMWICEKWSVEHASPLHNTVKAVWTEVFTA